MTPSPAARLGTRRTVVVCLCACLVMQAPAPGEGGTPSPGRAAQQLTAIQTLVDTYRRGNPGAAMAEFLTWDETRVARQATLPADAPPADVATLALMHTMAAVARGAFGAGNRPPVPDQTYYPAAHSLVNALSRRTETASDPGLRAFCRDWYIVTVSLWCAGRNYRQAAAVARAGRGRFGDDARVLLAAASAVEGLITPSTKESGGLSSPSESLAMDARDAKDWLRRALSLEPGLVEARLRLGRVLFLTNYVPQARAELEQALVDATAANHAFVAYLAALFLGELLERRGELDAARAAYEKAVALHPEYQAAHLALGQVLVASGRPMDGWAAAQRVFGDPGKPRTPAMDPWFLYPGAQFWQAEMLMRGMVAWVRR